jgi:hypothetical protein
MENNELTTKQLLPKAVEVLQQNLDIEFCSAPWMRRKLIINYGKALELMSLLERVGFVGPLDEDDRRKILKRA